MRFDLETNDQLPDWEYLSDATAFLVDHYNKDSAKSLVYHNYSRAKQIALYAFQLGNEEKVQQEELESLILAALFLESDLIVEDPSFDNKKVWQAFRTEMEYDHTTLIRVPALLSHYDDAERKSRLVNLLRDARLASDIEHFQVQLPYLKLEKEFLENSQIKMNLFYQDYLQKIRDHQFLSESGKKHFEHKRNELLLFLKTKLDKQSGDTLGQNGVQERLIRPFEGLEKKVPNSAIQTYFRTNYRNHINLSAIADNKANIMISVNAILISVVISIMSYQNLSETNPMVLLPVVIFLVTGMASLIFAVLSIRPKITALNTPPPKPAIAKKNIIFFGNFITLELAEYEEAVDAMLRDGELLYGNMVRDIYYLGLVLDKKYRFLTVSYNTFMVGFIATVLSFLMVLFF